MTTPLTDRSLKAIRHLVSTTHLSIMSPISRAFDPDRRAIDLEELEDWRWSSGEQVLISLIWCYATSSGGPAIADLLKLDAETRQAALESMKLFLVEREEAWA